MSTYTVTIPAFTIEADSSEEAMDKLADAMMAFDWKERMKAFSESELAEALAFYADPESYFATLIVPDRPAGLFADDIGCCLFNGEHDHRHGRRARRALGDEWGGTQPCQDFLDEYGEELND